MAEKKGAGGKNQSYDTANGRYGKMVEAVRKYSDTPAEDLASLGVKSLTETGNRDKLKKPKPKEFRDKLKQAKESNPPQTRWRVDIHEEDDYADDKLFVSEGGSCVAIEPNGNIISVCRNQSDTIRGKDLLRKAIENGGDRLDAFGEDLFDFYTRNGFEPVSYTKFNEEYAPEGWEKGRDKKEDIVFYRYTGEKTNLSFEDFINKTEPSQDYEEAARLRDEVMNK